MQKVERKDGEIETERKKERERQRERVEKTREKGRKRQRERQRNGGHLFKASLLFVVTESPSAFFAFGTTDKS